MRFKFYDPPGQNIRSRRCNLRFAIIDNHDPGGVEQNAENILATYTQIIYHIVFATKNRERVLDKSHREDLFRYIWGIVNNHNCHLFRLNGVEDHLHILTSVHPTVALADLVVSATLVALTV